MSQIQVESTIAAPVQKVWSRFTEPKHITQWNFASPDWQCPMASNDLRVGGKYSARMEAKDGSFGFEFEATYTEVVEGKRLAYTMPDGRKVMTSFEDHGDKTKVVTSFDPDKQNPEEMRAEVAGRPS